MEKYSVLMTVYDKEKPEHLRASIESMMNQTYPPDQFILSCDGPLKDGLIEVAMEYYKKYKGVFEPIFSKRNHGTAYAANKGMKKCRNEIIVRMDSDDISHIDRCEKQLKMFEEKPQLDIIGAYIEEFDSNTGKPVAVKKTPVTFADIIKYSKRRNPFNNQTIAMKKSKAEKIGGYHELRRCEDYDFVCRMLMDGAVGENIPEVLVDYRVTAANYERRSNWTNTKSFIRVRWINLRRGFSSPLDFIVAVGMQLFIFIMPSKLTGKIYKRFLRKQ